MPTEEQIAQYKESNFAFISRCTPEAILNDWLVIISAAIGLLFTLSVRLMLTATDRESVVETLAAATPEAPAPVQEPAAPAAAPAYARSYLAVSEKFELDDGRRSSRKVRPREMFPPAIKPKAETSH